RDAFDVANHTLSVTDRWSFTRLPGTEIDIDSNVSIIGEGNYTLLKGDETTQSKVISSFRYPDLLYFATHGISDPETPLDNSFLALAEDSNAYHTTQILDNCINV